MNRLTKSTRVFAAICACFILIIIAIGLIIFYLSNSYMGKNKAKQVIYNRYTNADINNIDLNEENNVKVYEIEYSNLSGKFEAKVNAITGEILSDSYLNSGVQDSRFEIPVFDNQENINLDVLPVNSKKTMDKISTETAKIIALSDAGLPKSDITFSKAFCEYVSDSPIYEIEFHNTNSKYEYEINAYTGAIIKCDIKQY
ncbi:MAG: PepSY domain-containing protein [Bacillota bacterium]|nr:PepSY domain-containing protein [Bacillota bacterium]